jgi:hypothetical protein
MADNRLIVTLHLKNGITHMSDPIAADDVDVRDIMEDVKFALLGEDGVLQFICNENTVLIANNAILSATFDYREFDEAIDAQFAGA